MQKRTFLTPKNLLIFGDLLLSGVASFAAQFVIAKDALSYAAVLQAGGNAAATAAATGLVFWLVGLFSLERMSRQWYSTLLLHLAAAMSLLSCLVLTARFLLDGLSGASAGLILAASLALQFFAVAIWHFIFWRSARAQRQLGKILLHRHRY